MMRSLLRSVIHNATVTGVEGSWPVRLRLDAFVLRAAGMLPFEEVEVINVATGEYLRTWVEPATEGTGEVALHGGPRTLVRRGDVISIRCFVSLHEGQTLAHKARMVTVDAQIRVVQAEDCGLAE